MSEDVGDMPTPHVEEPEKFPGGADALADPSRYGEIPDGPMGVDLPPDLHPDGADAPEAVTEPDDKSQEPDASDEQAQESDEPETPV